MRFNKFWKDAVPDQYIAFALAVCTFGLLSFTPLFMNFEKMLFRTVSSVLELEWLGIITDIVAMVVSMAPLTTAVVICGLVSRLALATLRLAEFKLLRHRLKRLEKSLAVKGHPYRVAPEDSQMRVRVEVELEDDIALHAELQNELKEMAS